MISSSKVFVGRKLELGEFSQAYQKCLSDGALLGVIRGQPGIGKTSLLEAFSAKIAELPNRPIVVMARCDSASRAKAPYHVMGQLLPKLLESKESDKTYQRDVMLGNILRVSGELLKDYAPALLNLVLPGAASLVSSSVNALNEIGDKASGALMTQVIDAQDDQIDKLSALLVEISLRQTVILIVDDAHFADPISISVLLHIFKKYPASRIMLLLGIRSSYKRQKLDDELSTLEELLAVSRGLDCNLDEMPDTVRREFLNELLDLEPNDLNESFKAQLFKRTDGHPLLTREILLGLVSNNSIFQQKEGHWSAVNDISWAQAPINIRDAVTQRMQQLSPEEQELLRVASVFDGEILSCIAAEFINCSDWDTLCLLTRSLQNELAILRETRAFRIGNKLVVGFRFREPIFREYVYQTLSVGERLYIHDAIASGYISMFGDDVESVSSELAWHFEQAGRLREALELHRKSAQLAMAVGALSEALLHISRGITVLDGLSPDGERDALELCFLLLKSKILKARNGWSSSAIDDINEKAGVLAQRCGKSEEIEATLMSEWSSYLARADLNSSIHTAKQLLKNAEVSQCIASIILGHATTCNSLFWLGDIQGANVNACMALSLYTAELGQKMIAQHGFDPIVIAQMFAVWTSHILGNYADLNKFKRNASFTVQQGHPFSSVIAQMTLCWQASHEGDAQAVMVEAGKLKNIADKGEFTSYQGLSDIFMGWTVAMCTGDYRNGLTQLDKGGDIWFETSGALISTYRSILRIDLLFALNDFEGVQAELLAAFKFTEENHEAAYASELWRIQGKAYSLNPNKHTESVDAYRKSVSLAKEKGMRTFELASLTDLLEVCSVSEKEAIIRRIQYLFEEMECQGKNTLAVRVQKLLDSYV